MIEFLASALMFPFLCFVIFTWLCVQDVKKTRQQSIDTEERDKDETHLDQLRVKLLHELVKGNRDITLWTLRNPEIMAKALQEDLDNAGVSDLVKLKVKHLSER